MMTRWLRVSVAAGFVGMMANILLRSEGTERFVLGLFLCLFGVALYVIQTRELWQK